MGPQSHLSVVLGWQYAVLAKCVYGRKDVICAGDSAVTFPDTKSLRHEGDGAGAARHAEIATRSATKRREVDAMISKRRTGMLSS